MSWTSSKTIESADDKNHRCCYCMKIFGRYRGLMRHQNTCFFNPNLNSISKKLKIHICCNCGASYTHKSRLTYHLRHDCNQIHKCENCGTIYSDTNGLRRHLNNSVCGKK